MKAFVLIYLSITMLMKKYKLVSNYGDNRESACVFCFCYRNFVLFV